MRELLVDPEFMRLVAEITAKIEAVRPRKPRERRDRWVRLAAHVVIEAMTVQQLRDAVTEEGPRHECPECGEQARRKQKNAERTLMTVCGPLTIARSTYVCPECGERFTPLDEELGVEPGSDCTAAMRELTAFLHADMPVESAAAVVEKMLGFRPAPSVLHRAVQIEGARAMRMMDAESQALKRAMTPLGPTATPMGLREHPVALLQIDGCMLRERRDPGDAGPDWHETKLAVVSDLGARSAKEPSAGEIARARLQGRSPRGRESLTRSAIVASNKNLRENGEFADRLFAEGVRWGLPTAAQIHTVCDGAPWIVNLVRELFDTGKGGPKLTFALDWQHAQRHLAAAAEALPGDAGSREQRRRRWADRLWHHGDARSVARSMRRAADRPDTPAEARQTLLTEAAYFATRQAMLNYPAHRKAGLPVASGAVEGSCRHFAQSRCKRPGMSWSHTGLAGTLALRLYRRNDRWTHLYPDAAA